MGIRIKERRTFSIDAHLYTVCLPGRRRVAVTVTTAPRAVRAWLNHTRRLHFFRSRKLVVGLGVQWRPGTRYNNRSRVATLQLCVGHRCLIFLPLHAPSIPPSLRVFLAETSTTFVGVSNFRDANYLYSDHGLLVHAPFDLRGLAAELCDLPALRRASLGTLARVVLGMDGVAKDIDVGMSDWDAVKLNKDQVLYACVDAFVSFEMGRVLRAWRMNR